MIGRGFCFCGCGGKTAIAKKTNNKRGDIKGEPVRYIHNHHSKKKEGQFVDVYRFDGYGKNNKKYIHRKVAEKALGKPLPHKAVVHHWDENRSNNANPNLLICQDKAYHKLIHMRMEAYKESGNPNWRKCVRCKKYDDPSNMKPDRSKKLITAQYAHQECNNLHSVRVYNEIRKRGK